MIPTIGINFNLIIRIKKKRSFKIFFIRNIKLKQNSNDFSIFKEVKESPYWKKACFLVSLCWFTFLFNLSISLMK